MCCTPQVCLPNTDHMTALRRQRRKRSVHNIMPTLQSVTAHFQIAHCRVYQRETSCTITHNNYDQFDLQFTEVSFLYAVSDLERAIAGLVQFDRKSPPNICLVGHFVAANICSY